MEKCHYCGIQYHPMPVWINRVTRIHVCTIRIVLDGNNAPDVLPNYECEKKAIADGFTKRLDLTPKR
jgi:hypothetical protein